MLQLQANDRKHVILRLWSYFCGFKILQNSRMSFALPLYVTPLTCKPNKQRSRMGDCNTERHARVLRSPDSR
jgi:hypothetical protein